MKESGHGFDLESPTIACFIAYELVGEKKK